MVTNEDQKTKEDEKDDGLEGNTIVEYDPDKKKPIEANGPPKSIMSKSPIGTFMRDDSKGGITTVDGDVMSEMERDNYHDTMQTTKMKTGFTKQPTKIVSKGKISFRNT